MSYVSWVCGNVSYPLLGIEVSLERVNLMVSYSAQFSSGGDIKDQPPSGIDTTATRFDTAISSPKTSVTMRITIAAGFFTLIVPSLGYDVQFYTGIQCRGERLGGAVGLTPDDGCQDGSLYSINANSVYIAQGDTEEDLQIAFYGGDNCPLENAVATGNVGACLSVGGAYQQFDSYNAFPIIPRSKREDSVQSQVNDDPSNFQHGALFEDDDGVSCKTKAMALSPIPVCDR